MMPVDYTRARRLLSRRDPVLRDLMRALSAHRDGASINAAAKASGINYRTAQRIVKGAAEHCQRQLVAVV